MSQHACVSYITTERVLSICYVVASHLYCLLSNCEAWHDCGDSLPVSIIHRKSVPGLSTISSNQSDFKNTSNLQSAQDLEH